MHCPPALPPLLLAALLLLGGPARACTTVIVGKKASVDGSIYVARTDDTMNAIITNNALYHPARDGPAAFKSNVNDFQVVLPGSGLAYTAAAKWYGWNTWPLGYDRATGRNASKEETGINSAGVAISDTETIFNSDGALKADPYLNDTGLVEDSLTSVLLPQARSARHGVQLLAQLIASKGNGEGFGSIFADSSEAWYLETASGHHFLAQRVPDDKYFVSANQGRFQEANLADAANVVASPGLLKFAKDHKLWDPSQGPFNFFRAFHTDTPADHRSSYPRLCALQSFFGGQSNASCWASLPLSPVFLKASRKLSLWDMFAALRHHNEGTPQDPYGARNPRATTRPVAVLRQPVVHVTRMLPKQLPGGGRSQGRAGSSARPDGLSAINYLAFCFARLSPFIPIYRGTPGDALPPNLVSAGPTPDPVSLCWRARRLQAIVFQDWPRLAPAATQAIRAFEQQVENVERPALEARYIAALKRPGGARAAAAELASFTTSVAWRAGDLLAELTAGAARQLGLQGVPPDDVLQRWLNEAEDKYHFKSQG